MPGYHRPRSNSLLLQAKETYVEPGWPYERVVVAEDDGDGINDKNTSLSFCHCRRNCRLGRKMITVDQDLHLGDIYFVRSSASLQKGRKNILFAF